MTTPAAISVKNGAFIYSSDTDFNNQIGQLSVDGSVQISLNKDSSKKLIVLTSKPIKSAVKNFASHVQERVEKKKEDEAKKITKELGSKENKSHSEKDKINKPLSSENSFHSTTHTKHFAFQRVHSNKDSLIYISDYSYAVKKALDSLNAELHSSYNSKSLDFCFSRFFSVRPPPVLVL